jgi:hypothetical protein
MRIPALANTYGPDCKVKTGIQYIRAGLAWFSGPLQRNSEKGKTTRLDVRQRKWTIHGQSGLLHGEAQENNGKARGQRAEKEEIKFNEPMAQLRKRGWSRRGIDFVKFKKEANGIETISGPNIGIHAQKGNGNGNTSERTRARQFVEWNTFRAMNRIKAQHGDAGIGK